MRIVYFGNERIASGITLAETPVLSSLIAAGHDVCAVVCHHSEGISRGARTLEVAATAEAHGIPVLQPSKPAEIIDTLAELQADIGVLVAYGRIIPQSVIDLFPHDIINLHPSLLPLYRGSTPIESAMLHGDTATGASIMSLVAAMDAGPVYAQLPLALAGNETKQQLATDLLTLGAKAIVDLLPRIADGSVQPTTQVESAATFCPQLSKADSPLDPGTKDATRLEREVRAYAAWPKSRINLLGHDIVVTRAHVAPDPADGELSVSCAKDTTLVIDELIGPSGKRMDGAAFLRGYQK